MAVEHLAPHRPEERLHYPAAQAVALPGHRLPHALGREPLAALPHLALPALAGMGYEALDPGVGREGRVRHPDGLGEDRRPA